jgi:hypothetical protein
MAKAFPLAIWLKKASAIWLLPELWIHTKITVLLTGFS